MSDSFDGPCYMPDGREVIRDLLADALAGAECLECPGSADVCLVLDLAQNRAAAMVDVLGLLSPPPAEPKVAHVDRAALHRARLLAEYGDSLTDEERDRIGGRGLRFSAPAAGGFRRKGIAGDPDPISVAGDFDFWKEYGERQAEPQKPDSRAGVPEEPQKKVVICYV